MLMSNNMHYAINDNFSLTALENKGEVTREKREQTNEQQQQKKWALLSPSSSGILRLKSFLLLGN